MRRNIMVLVVSLALSLTLGARADMFDLGNEPEREILKLRFIYEGMDLHKPPDKPFNLRYSYAEANRSAVYETVHVGDGPNRHVEATVTGKAENGNIIRHFIKFKPGDKLVLDYYEKTVTTHAGKRIRLESYDLSASDPPLPENTIHPFALHLALRGMDFTPGNEREFYLWFNPLMVFAMKITVKGVEKVKVPAGTFDCYRFDMTPDLVDFSGPVVGRMLKPVVAKYALWLDKTPPHRLVKYEGPFGQINISSAPREAYELAAFE